jgi:hypothetical protein
MLVIVNSVRVYSVLVFLIVAAYIRYLGFGFLVLVSYCHNCYVLYVFVRFQICLKFKNQSGIVRLYIHVSMKFVFTGFLYIFKSAM